MKWAYSRRNYIEKLAIAQPHCCTLSHGGNSSVLLADRSLHIIRPEVPNHNFVDLQLNFATLVGSSNARTQAPKQTYIPDSSFADQRLRQ